MQREEFDNLIRTLLSPSNEERKTAEQAFEQLCSAPEQAAPLLCQTLAQCPDEAVRSLTAVMVRKRITSKFFKEL
eukprot:CAMPEP_0202814284 /NCGR_PEP_ID=MMETSP1389-20130828/5453_1 /ASSEMBLY_ACC=CAM_ASM_000865 /TAXON_ID=302021 /ORGANISM="Rhodomonas sp., Strain CCMP768" /LENGTH=74 /DNA_ID=CAMNT_0049486031 /DNA_START=51 /DNA_END=271 /DNA_ORIENTATION=-